MSSRPNHNDVLRTRITAYDDDNTVLCAYGPNKTYVRSRKRVVVDTSYKEGQQKTVLSVLSHCRVIYDGIQNLDKKLDVIHAKVPKIHRFRMKSLWQNRKPLGYAHKNYNFLLSRKIKFQKMRKQGPPSALSYPESDSPTFTGRERKENAVPSNPRETSFQSKSPSEPEQPLLRKPQPVLGERPLLPALLTRSLLPCVSPARPGPGPSDRPGFASSGAPRTSRVFSSAHASTAVATAMMVQEGPSATNNRDLISYGLLEKKSVSQSTKSSSLCVPSRLVSSSGTGLDSGDLTPRFSKDPSSWSVDEVIQFMEQMDPQAFTPLADLFRYHDVDGKALLLLKSNLMMKYMGLKLGTAIKLGHYIERLKQEKYFSD